MDAMFDNARDNLAAHAAAESFELTPELWAQTVAEAASMGADAGKAAGTWAFDGNTTEATWSAARRMYDEGDPALWDGYQSPLSGEWADGLTPDSLMDDLGIIARTATDEGHDELCTAYETAHSQAWADEVGRAIAAHYADETDDTLTMASTQAEVDYHLHGWED
jgi:hypothetical protein